MNTAAIITATAVLITALTGALVTIVHEIRVGRAETKMQTDSIHEIVNQQRTDMLTKIQYLEDLLIQRGGNPREADARIEADK